MSAMLFAPDNEDSETETSYFCTCFLCKAKNHVLGGQYLTYISYWRHQKKKEKWADADIDSSDDDDLQNLEDNYDLQNFNYEERYVIIILNY